MLSRARLLFRVTPALPRGAFWMCGLVFALLACAAQPVAARSLLSLSDGAFRAELSTPFDAPVAGGYFPLLLRVENLSARERSFSVRLSSSDFQGRPSSYTFFETVTVPGRTTQQFEFLAPIVEAAESTAGAGFAFDYRNVQVDVALIGDGHSRNTSLFRSTPGAVEFAVSQSLKALASTHQNEIQFRAGPHYGDTNGFEPDQLPSDWRAYLGLSSVLMRGSEWTALRPWQQEALLQWVAWGGRLDINWDLSIVPDTFLVPQGSSGPAQPRIYGLGVIALDFGKPEDFVASALNAMEAFGFEKPQALGLSSFAATADRSYLGYQLAVVAFLICIGPLNIAYFCRPPHRLRLFFTTPLIAGAFLLIVFAYSLARDGIGGEGVRSTLIVYLPETRSALDIQVQVSNTGLVWPSGFHLPEGTAMRQIDVMGTLGAHAAVAERRLTQGRFEGDWLRSRWSQAHATAQERPTREQLLIEPGAAGEAPWARSEINDTLLDLRYTDGEGAVWWVARLSQGDRKQLARVDSAVSHPPPWQALLTPRRRSVEAASYHLAHLWVARKEGSARPDIDLFPKLDWRIDSRYAYGHAVLTAAEKEDPQL